jgi:hypothetical protein
MFIITTWHNDGWRLRPECWHGVCLNWIASLSLCTQILPPSTLVFALSLIVFIYGHKSIGKKEILWLKVLNLTNIAGRMFLHQGNTKLEYFFRFVVLIWQGLTIKSQDKWKPHKEDLIFELHTLLLW